MSTKVGTDVLNDQHSGHNQESPSHPSVETQCKEIQIEIAAIESAKDAGLTISTDRSMTYVSGFEAGVAWCSNRESPSVASDDGLWNENKTRISELREKFEDEDDGLTFDESHEFTCRLLNEIDRLAIRETTPELRTIASGNEIPKDLLQDLRDIRDELDTEITKLDLDHEDIRCRIYKRLSFHLLRLRETTPLAPDDRSVGEELLRSELASVYRDLDHTLRTGCMTADEQLKRTRLQVKETLDRWATLRASHLQTVSVTTKVEE